MKAKVAAKMWKIKILLGRYPAKIEEYRLTKLRIQILNLFKTIEGVSYDNITIDEVKSALIEYYHYTDYICEVLYSKNEVNKNKKTRIIYCKNNKFKWDIEEENNKIIVKVPTEAF